MQRDATDDASNDAAALRRLAVRIFFINIAVLAAAFTLYWFWVANAVELEILQWIDRQRAAGQTLDFSGYRRGGYPLAVTLTFRDVRYAPAAAGSGWTYRVDGVTLSHPIHDSSSLGLTLSGGQELAIGAGAGRNRYGGAFEIAQATLRAGGWLPNGEVAAREFALFDETSRRGVAVGSLDVTASGNPAAPPSPEEAGYRLTLTAGRVALPGIVALPLGSEVAELSIDAEVIGAVLPQPWPEQLTAWREAGGTIELTRIYAVHGPLIAEGSGTLTLSPDNQPEAAFSFSVEGLVPLLDRLAATGALDGATAAGLKGLAMVGAKTGADGRSRVRLPLTLQDRELSLGPVRLATLPVIRWPDARVAPVDE